MFRIFLLIFICAAVGIFPGSARAYVTTNQEAFTADGKVGVFVIDYRFGHGTYDLTMPLSALRNPDPENKKTLGFEILNKDGTEGKGSAVGVVLSDASVQNGVYAVPKGKAVSFRLLVLYTRANDEVNDAFRLHVTSLPFAFTGVRELALNTSELEAYTTGLVPFSETPIRVSHTETK